MKGLSELRHPEEFSNLVGPEVVEALEREAFLLDFFDDVDGNLLELSQRAHRLPHPAVAHLGQRQRLVRQLSPAVEQHDLEDGPKIVFGSLENETELI